MKSAQPILLTIGILTAAPLIMAPGSHGCAHCLSAEVVWVLPAGDGSRIDILIENQADSPVGDFSADIYINRYSPPNWGDPPDVIQRARIAANGTETITFYVTAPPDELAWIDVIVEMGPPDATCASLATFEIRP